MAKQKHQQTYRHITVYYGFTKVKYRKIPVIRLGGNYLTAIGFKIGDKLCVELADNKVTIIKK